MKKHASESPSARPERLADRSSRCLISGSVLFLLLPRSVHLASELYPEFVRMAFCTTIVTLTSKYLQRTLWHGERSNLLLFGCAQIGLHMSSRRTSYILDNNCALKERLIV